MGRECRGGFDEAIGLGLNVGIGCVAEEFSRTICENCSEGGKGGDGDQKTMHDFKELYSEDVFDANVFS